jgi:Protein of unknown function (DUF1376)
MAIDPMTIGLPSPPVPADADLRDFQFTPIFRARLFGSSFHARSSDAEWRAGVTLWLKSWDQMPPGSLPDDDVDLCRLAELGRDAKTWRELKAGALRGWYKCSDGRLYHDVVAEGVNGAIKRKKDQRDKTLKARIAALTKRIKESSDADARSHMTEELERLLLTQSQALSLTSGKRSTKSVTESVTHSVTESKGEREGQGEGNVRVLPRRDNLG